MYAKTYRQRSLLGPVSGSWRLTLGVLCLCLGVAGTALAASEQFFQSGQTDGPEFIATGPDTSADAYLEVRPDEFGSFGDYILGPDAYNPAGSLTLLTPSFSSWTLLFVPDRMQRETLSSLPLDDDASLTRTVIVANTPSDSNGDGVADTVTSSFRVEGVQTNLLIDLVQQVLQPAAGVAQLTQQFSITNEAATAIGFDLVRNYDGDLLWVGDFSDDEVGTSMHSAGLGTFVIQQEPSQPAVTAVTLSSPSALNYYGGKQGVEPENGPPPYGYGTDSQIWNEYGIPASWVDHIAGVGYSMNGLSGSYPPGSFFPEDAFMGIGEHVDLDVGENVLVCLYYTYGSDVPVDASACGEEGKQKKQKGEKVALCHVPPGNPDNAHTIWVSESAVPAHLAHGDTQGPCR